MTTKHRNKAALVNAIRTEHQRLENTFADLSKKDMVVKGVVGTWSLKDLLSHLTAWERFWMEWYALSLHGRTPALLPISLKAVHALNAYIFEINHKRTLDDIVDEFAISYQEALAVVERIPEQDMFYDS